MIELNFKQPELIVMLVYKILIQYQTDQVPVIMDVEYNILPKDFKIWGWDPFAEAPIYAPADAPSHLEKLDASLNHRRKVSFESHLGFSVLKSYKLFHPTLHKLGNAMADYLDQHLHTEGRLAAGKLFKKILYSNKGIFGVLGAESNEPDLKVYKIGIDLLRKGKAIEQIFTAHIAALKIFREVLEKENDDFIYWWKKIRGDLFQNNRGREKLNVSVKLVDFPGIEVEPTITQTVQKHRRAADKTIRDVLVVTPFIWEAYQKEIPIIAGPSGTASECLVGVKTLGKKAGLNAEELKEYLFCCLGYLVSGGAHSIHEIYILTKELGIDYKTGRYEDIIPEVYKETSEFKELCSRFDDVIRMPSSVASTRAITQLLTESSPVTARIDSMPDLEASSTTPFTPYPLASGSRSSSSVSGSFSSVFGFDTPTSTAQFAEGQVLPRFTNTLSNKSSLVPTPTSPYKNRVAVIAKEEEMKPPAFKKLRF